MNTVLTAVPALLGIALSLALAGCASAPVRPDAAASHPAHPQALASPLPPWQPALLSSTNVVTKQPAETTPEHHHDHGQHQPKPGTEEKK